jgi:hypothetical protein
LASGKLPRRTVNSTWRRKAESHIILSSFDLLADLFKELKITNYKLKIEDLIIKLREAILTAKLHDF